MKKISYVLISAIVLSLFSGCTSTKTVTKLVPEPFPICEELTIYEIATKEITTRIHPLYKTYLQKKKEEYQGVINSFTKQAITHNEYCRKIKAKYERSKNASK